MESDASSSDTSSSDTSSSDVSPPDAAPSEASPSDDSSEDSKLELNLDEDRKIFIETIGKQLHQGRYLDCDNLCFRVLEAQMYPRISKVGMIYNYWYKELKSIKTFKTREEFDLAKILDENTKNMIPSVKICEEDYDKLMRNAHNYIYMTCSDCDFISAIEDIKSFEEIAVYGVGCKNGPYGRLTLLCISTKKSIYLFDLRLMGTRAFSAGLKEILQDKNIIKIVHGIDAIKLCLHCTHGCQLNGLYDTQIADQHLLRKYVGIKRGHLRPFDEVFEHHVCLPGAIIRRSDVCEVKTDIRPLDDNIKLLAALKVAHLHLLKQVIENELRLNYNTVQNAYKNHLTCETTQEGFAAKMQPFNELPQDIKDMFVENKLL